jgi:hypothetical protein
MSYLYSGTVFHKRHAEPEQSTSSVKHEFSYDVYYALLNLDLYDESLTSLKSGLAWLQTIRAVIFDSKDHLRREAFQSATNQEYTRGIYDSADSVQSGAGARLLSDRGMAPREDRRLLIRTNERHKISQDRAFALQFAPWFSTRQANDRLGPFSF